MLSPSSPESADTVEPTQAEVRLILRVVGALVFLAIAAGVATLCARTAGDGDDAETGVAAEADGIGPLPGTPLATYTARRSQVLAEARGTRAAVVSFTRYRDEASARAVVSDLRVRALLVAGPGGAPAVVTGPLAEWVDEARTDAATERRELGGMLDTEDPSFRAQFQADIARLDAFLARLDARGEIVFGVVVDAETAVLRDLAQLPPVRFVDVGPDATVPPADRTRGIRPEETVRAAVPPERPL